MMQLRLFRKCACLIFPSEGTLLQTVWFWKMTVVWQPGLRHLPQVGAGLSRGVPHVQQRGGSGHRWGTAAGPLQGRGQERELGRSHGFITGLSYALQVLTRGTCECGPGGSWGLCPEV